MVSVKQTPVFVVSLKRSEHRRTEISARLRELGLEFEFFDAVDGSALGPEHAALVDHKFTKARRWLRRRISPGEVGCALSHSLVYEKMLAEGIESAFILEDDAIPSPTLAFLVQQGTLAKHSQIELATFYHPPLVALRWGSLELCPGIHAYRPLQRLYGAVTYYVTQAGARRLRDAAFPISTVADWPDMVHRWGTAYCVSPRVVETSLQREHSILQVGRDEIDVEQFANTETMSLLGWPAPLRVLGRLLSLTLVPSMLWPKTFGTVKDSKRFANRLRVDLQNLSTNFTSWILLRTVGVQI